MKANTGANGYVTGLLQPVLAVPCDHIKQQLEHNFYPCLFYCDESKAVLCVKHHEYVCTGSIASVNRYPYHVGLSPDCRRIARNRGRPLRAISEHFTAQPAASSCFAELLWSPKCEGLEIDIGPSVVHKLHQRSC